jgi:hypothetical protein
VKRSIIFIEDLLMEVYFKEDVKEERWNCSPHEDSFESRKKQEEWKKKLIQDYSNWNYEE